MSLYEQVQNQLNRYHKINPEVWNHRNNGCAKNGNPIVELYNNLKEDETWEDEEKKKKYEKCIEKFEAILTKGESKQKEREEQEDILNTKYGIYLKIISQPEFDKAIETSAIFKISYEGLKKKFNDYVFDNNNKVISGKVSSMFVKAINVDPFENQWNKALEKISNGDNTIIAPKQKKTNKSSSLKDTIENGMKQYQKDIQNASQEMKDKAQKLQDLIANYNPDNDQVMMELFKEFQNLFTKPGDVGTCTTCKQSKKVLFGKSKTCFECYNEYELEEAISLIYAKEKKFFSKLSTSKKNQYINNIKNKYATLLEKFQSTKKRDYYDKLMLVWERANKLMESITVSKEELDDVNDSCVVSDDDEIEDDEEEEEEEGDEIEDDDNGIILDDDDDDDDDDDIEYHSENYSHPLYKNGLPSDYNSSDEFKDIKKKSKKRDRHDDEMIGDILEIAATGTEDDRNKMYKVFKDDPMGFPMVVREIINNKRTKYKYVLFRSDGEPIEEVLQPSKLYYSLEDAENAANKYLENLPKCSFKIIEL